MTDDSSEATGLTLDKLSDDALSEVFAVEVAGYYGVLQGICFSVKPDRNGDPEQIQECNADFATSANAVLPWLEKHRARVIYTHIAGWYCCVECACNHVEATSKTFARAACIALIRAARARKGAGA